MPGTYSKLASDSDPQVHAGGPLKRTGKAAEEWDKALGPSISSLPCSQLPQVRTVLQRFRALRIEDPQRDTKSLAKGIAEEVRAIWDKARLPTASSYGCERKVMDVIKFWYKHHVPGAKFADQVQTRLNSLFNIAVRISNQSDDKFLENYKILLRKNGSSMWETDYKFFLDQFKVIDF